MRGNFGWFWSLTLKRKCYVLGPLRNLSFINFGLKLSIANRQKQTQPPPLISGRGKYHQADLSFENNLLLLLSCFLHLRLKLSHIIFSPREIQQLQLENTLCDKLHRNAWSHDPGLTVALLFPLQGFAYWFECLFFYILVSLVPVLVLV